MRFNIIHERTDTVIGETDQIEVALAVLRGDEHKQFTVVDKWSGVGIDRPAAAAVTGIPVSYIKHTLTRFYLQGGQSPKIGLIKLVRELTGWGLGEAKAYIDKLDAEESLRARQVDTNETDW